MLAWLMYRREALSIGASMYDIRTEWQKDEEGGREIFLTVGRTVNRFCGLSADVVCGSPLSRSRSPGGNGMAEENGGDLCVRAERGRASQHFRMIAGFLVGLWWSMPLSPLTHKDSFPLLQSALLQTLWHTVDKIWEKETVQSTISGKTVARGRESTTIPSLSTPWFSMLLWCYFPEHMRCCNSNITSLDRSKVRSSRENWPDKKYWPSKHF